MSEGVQTFEAIGIQRKYHKLIYGGVFFVFLGAAIIIGGYLYFNAQGAYAHDAPRSVYSVLPFFMILLFLYGVSIFRRGLTQVKLFKRSTVKGLRLDHDSLSVSVLLLEGVYAEALVLKDVSDFTFAWSGINNFIVEPVRGGKRNQSPPYYKITFVGQGEDMNSSCYILREPFKRDDAQIIDYVRERIGDDRLVLNDEIYV